MGCDCSGELSQIKSEINGVQSQLSTFNGKFEEFHQTFYGASARNDEYPSHSTKEGPVTGVKGMPAPVRFSNWAAPEVSGTSSSLWDNLMRAAALAIAILNASYQSQIADLNQDLADSYYSMAKYKWDRFYATFRPLEQDIVNEVMNYQWPELNCDDDRSRASMAVDTAYSMATTFIKQKAKAMRICIDSSLSDRMDFRKSTMNVDTENYNISDDQWYDDYTTDKIWNRRLQTANLGRNLTSIALQYGDVSRSLANKVGGQVNEAASTVIGALGYYGGRNDTYYPSVFLSSNGAASSTLTSTGTGLGGVGAFGGVSFAGGK